MKNIKDIKDVRNQYPVQIGVLGGLGPLATVEFEKLFFKEAQRVLKPKSDQQYPNLFVNIVSTTPDRTAYIMDQTKPDPTPFLQSALSKLESIGCNLIVIPCITAHHFMPRLCPKEGTTLLNLIEETVEFCIKSRYQQTLLLATQGTMKSGVFVKGASAKGLKLILLTDEDLINLMDIIYGQTGVKRGFVDESNQERLKELVSRYKVDSVILACTELGLIGGKITVPTIDPMQIGAQNLLNILNKLNKKKHQSNLPLFAASSALRDLQSLEMIATDALAFFKKNDAYHLTSDPYSVENFVTFSLDEMCTYPHLPWGTMLLYRLLQQYSKWAETNQEQRKHILPLVSDVSSGYAASYLLAAIAQNPLLEDRVLVWLFEVTIVHLNPKTAWALDGAVSSAVKALEQCYVAFAKRPFLQKIYDFADCYLRDLLVFNAKEYVGFYQGNMDNSMIMTRWQRGLDALFTCKDAAFKAMLVSQISQYIYRTEVPIFGNKIIIKSLLQLAFSLDYKTCKALISNWLHSFLLQLPYVDMSLVATNFSKNDQWASHLLAQKHNPSFTMQDHYLKQSMIQFAALLAEVEKEVDPVPCSQKQQLSCFFNEDALICNPKILCFSQISTPNDWVQYYRDKDKTIALPLTHYWQTRNLSKANQSKLEVAFFPPRSPEWEINTPRQIDWDFRCFMQVLYGAFLQLFLPFAERKNTEFGAIIRFPLAHVDLIPKIYNKILPHLSSPQMVETLIVTVQSSPNLLSSLYQLTQDPRNVKQMQSYVDKALMKTNDPKTDNIEPTIFYVLNLKEHNPSFVPELYYQAYHCFLAFNGAWVDRSIITKPKELPAQIQIGEPWSLKIGQKKYTGPTSNVRTVV
jgi:aspartate racemase